MKVNEHRGVGFAGQGGICLNDIEANEVARREKIYVNIVSA